MITLLNRDERERTAAVEAVLRRCRAERGRLLLIADGPASDALERAVRAARCCPPELVQFVRPEPGSLSVEVGRYALYRGLRSLVLPFVGGPTALVVWIECLLDLRGLAACGGLAGYERGLARHVEPLVAALISAYWAADVGPWVLGAGRMQALLLGTRGAESRIPLVRRDADLNELARAALRLAAEDCAARGIGLEAALVEGPLRGRFDPGRMMQVLLTLLVDAIASDPSPGGALRVGTRSGEGGRTAVLAVERGRARGRVRRPFFSAGPDEVGLGLHTSRQILVAHGGSIHTESRDGGLTFTVVLPLCG